MTGARDLIKNAGGWAMARMHSGLSYRNCIFVLAHMRCGSTALSNIISSRGDVNGYGETHVRYDGQGALVRIVSQGRVLKRQVHLGYHLPQRREERPPASGPPTQTEAS